MALWPGWWLASVVARATGKRALYAASPPCFLLGVVAIVAFAGNGKDARTVTDAALASPPLRLASLFGWVMLTLLCGFVAALRTHALGAPAALDPSWRARLGLGAVWGQRLRSLSFGQRKRVALLAALIGEPRLLILDSLRTASISQAWTF
jgi:ABC transporter family protein